MTDLEKFVELYKSVGIDVKVNEKKIFEQFVIELTDTWEIEDMTKNDKIYGHNGLYTEIIFDKNGKFINQGIWEIYNE